MTIYTITDARRAGFCVEGLRDFAEQHNLSYRDFIRNGIDRDVLLGLGEIEIVNMLEKARSENV